MSEKDPGCGVLQREIVRRTCCITERMSERDVLHYIENEGEGRGVLERE